jgi:hypothetical protein
MVIVLRLFDPYENPMVLLKTSINNLMNRCIMTVDSQVTGNIQEENDQKSVTDAASITRTMS